MQSAPRAIMSPTEFRMTMAHLRERFQLRTTSQYRPNDPPPGKHRYGLAEDCQFERVAHGTPNSARSTALHPSVVEILIYARSELGLWCLYHAGEHPKALLHFHFQGAGVGPLPHAWHSMYLVDLGDDS